jgi:hypothetical protein
MKSSEMNGSAHEHGPCNRNPFAHSLRGLATAAFLGAALLSASTSALAGIPGIDASLTSLVPGAAGAKVISYSTGETYQSAYEVRITNNTSSNINNVFFTAVTNVTNGLSAPFTVPVTGLRPGDSCTPSMGNTRLDCQFVSLPGGTAPIVLTLLVPSPLAPEAVNGTVADSTLSVGWSIQSGQGNQNPSNLVFDLSEAITLKVGSAKDGVQSYVLANTVLSVADAGAATKVKPPKPVTVGIKQIVPGASCSPQNKKCFESTITIVNDSGAEVPFTQADPLQIDLFRPVSSLKKNARFANVTLFYQRGSDSWAPIPTCELALVPPSPTQPYAIPTSYPFRCVTPQVLPYATTGQTGVDALGNMYFHILGLFNGIINW